MPNFRRLCSIKVNVIGLRHLNRNFKVNELIISVFLQRERSSGRTEEILMMI